MIRLALLAGIAGMALCAAPAAHAQRVSPITGAKLLGVCTARGAGETTACDAYVSGIADTLAVMEALGREANSPIHVPALVCVPGATTGVQLRATVVAWLRAHADQDGKQAAPLVMSALRAAYPCQNGPV